jgi:ATP adenylyltransferase
VARRSDPGGLERLWAPWRMAYVAQASRVAGRRRPRRKTSNADCLFCAVSARRRDRADLVIARQGEALLMLNRFPYSPAHLMVAVRRHAAEFRELDAAERNDLIDLLALGERILAVEYQPDGLNYGANRGRVAGAGFPGHLHLHLVPRWNGDTNFMPVVGGTKVLPESLDRTWSRLRSAVQSMTKGKRGRQK